MSQENKTYQMENLDLFAYDPIVLVHDVLRRWHFIVIAALLAGMVAYMGATLRYVPDYTTRTTFVVTSRGNSTTVYQNLQSASNLASVFSEVLNSSILRKTILEELELPYFDGTIQASPVPETNLISMQITGHDPRTAFRMTRSIIENHELVSRQVVGDIVLEILQDPVVPVAPSNQSHAGGSMKKAALLAGAAMCALLGVLSFCKDTIRSRQEAEQKLEERVLGELHHERKVKNVRGMYNQAKTSILITNPTISFGFVEEIRKFRRQVEHVMPENARTILVTSVLENEGKSTVAENLAISLAQKKKRVLLIDGDLRRPACYKVLEQPKTLLGTTDVIVGRTSLADAVCVYNKQPTLELLMEFRLHKNATDLLNSKSMAKLLEDAAAAYDYVVIDTPPMSVGPDSECLTELVDAAILVVRQDQAHARMVNNALDVMHRARCKVLGCVINNVCAPVFTRMNTTGSNGYGYGDYGTYGAYGHYNNRHQLMGGKKAGATHEE